MSKYVKGAGLLIALYLGVAYATGSGRLIDSGSKGAVGVIKAFQGRG